jgi:dTDP-D-glucose 4,6-dehydratase
MRSGVKGKQWEVFGDQEIKNTKMVGIISLVKRKRKMQEKKMKKQKVRFSRGDKRPAIYKYKLSYEKKLVKKDR